jgi:hypothetical protein
MMLSLLRRSPRLVSMFLVAGLVLFWVLLHIFIRSSDEDPALLISPDSRRRSSTPPRSTRWTLHLLSLHISTTALNHLPPALIQPWRKRRRRKLSLVVKDDERPLSWFWEVGALAGVLGLLVAQGVLAWAALRSVTVLLKVLSTDRSAAPRLAKRALEHATSGASPAADLLLRPVVSFAVFNILFSSSRGSLLADPGTHPTSFGATPTPRRPSLRPNLS